MTTTSSAEMFSPVAGRVRLLLERESNLDLICSSAENVVSGDGALIVVDGPAGIGKTSLLGEARRRAGIAGLNVLHARAGELEHGFGFGVVRQLFEAQVAYAPDARRERIFAGAARLAEAVFTDTADQASTAFATLHGLHWLAANMAETAPLLLCVDDAQWCDEPSLRFLLHLAQRRTDLRVLIVVAWRDDASQLNELLQMILLEADSVVRLQPLGPDGVAAVVRNSLGSAATDVLIESCRRASGGNPFMLSELVGELQRGGIPLDDPDRVQHVAPERISVSVRHRIRSVCDGALHFARCIAVLGDCARLTYAAALAGIEPSIARDLARRLANVSVLVDNDPLDFSHPMIRTAIYGDIPRNELATLHRRAAEILIRQHVEATVVAIHLLAADPAGDQRVVDVLRSAAEIAMFRGSPDTAETWLRRAIDEPPDAVHRAQVLFELGIAELELGRETAIARLLECADATDDPIEEAKSLITCSSAISMIHHWGDVIPRLEEAAARMRPIDRELSLQLEAARLSGYVFTSELAPAYVDETARFEDLPAETSGECMLLSFVARRALALGQIQRAGVLAERSISHPDFDSRSGNFLWRANATFALVEAERYDVAEQALTRAINTATRMGSAQWLLRVYWHRAVVRRHRGDLKGAETDARAALGVARMPGFRGKHGASDLVASLAAQGRVDEAEKVLVEHGPADIPAPTLVSIHPLVARAELRAAQGNLTHARADLMRALELIEQNARMISPFDARIALIGVLRMMNEHDTALELAELTRCDARAGGSVRAEGAALREMGLLRGGAEGLDLLRQAVEVLEDSPSLLIRAGALVEYGAALRRNAQRTEARRFLRAGLDIAERCGATPLADHAAEELRIAGARVSRRSVGIDALTASERRVAQLAAEGLSNKDIAQTLFVTLRTVEMHLSSTYAKLEIRSRQQIAASLGPAEPDLRKR